MSADAIDDLEPPEAIAQTVVEQPRAQNAASLSGIVVARWVRWFGRFAAVVLLVVPIAVLLTPWRQHISGVGQVSAFRPLDRPQPVEATISGRVQEWFVQEGSRVKKGQRLFRIEDQDADRLERLQEQRRNLLAKAEFKEGQVKNLASTVSELRLTRDSLIDAINAEIDDARQKVEAAEQKLRATKSKRDYAAQALEARQRLLDKQLEPRLKVQEAEADLAIANAEVGMAEAGVAGAKATVREMQAKLEATRAKENAAIEKALGDIGEKESELQDVKKEIQEQDTKIARQKSQEALAPRDGTVFRLEGGQGGQIVKEGDRILTFVPDAIELAVELWIDGNDAPLVEPGDPVRLQFEGWPAVQSVGWPSAAIGTFGGRVSLIDPADDGRGRFRVLVQPDPDDEPWPDPIYLRQGARTKGWILLNEVSIAWEIWRQLNGFPPIAYGEDIGELTLKLSK